MKKIKKVTNVLLALFTNGNRFKKLDDGWILDTLCKIELGPTSAEEMNFKDAQEYCAKLGGRLPEVNELQSLVDYSRKFPAINVEVFPDTKSSWYWTNTPCLYWENCAWVVGFGSGSVGSLNEDYHNYVRPCRASQ